MKTLTISALHLENFKGIKSLSLEPGGQDISVLGENGTGKSTIADAFFYLLFGKDSHDKADFQLKPVTDGGQEIHNLETIVEAGLEVNHKPVTLKKVYKEKWTVKRGTTTKEHTGHTTKHYIDDVPKKAGEFANAVADIIDINAFKLVTNPLEFNNLHWPGRRQILIDICGDVSDKDVIASDKKLAKLAEIIGDTPIDDHRAKIKETQKKINEDLKEIPARIDELTNSIKSIEKPDQKEKDRLDKELEEFKEELRSLQTNERLSELQVKLNEVNAKILALNSDADKKQAEIRRPLLQVIEKLESERRSTISRIQELEAQVKTDENRNRLASDAKDSKEKEWYAVDEEQPKNDNSCPTCGQSLPEDQIQAAIEKFNQKKAERLEKIEAEGLILKEGIVQREKGIKKDNKEVYDLSCAIVEIDAALEVKKKDLNAAYVPVNADDLDKEKDILEHQISALKNGNQTQVDTVNRHIQEAQAKVDEWKETEAAWKSAESSRVRISDLEKEEKDLAALYEKLSEEIYLIEKFIVRKVEMLEENINSRFKLARFKMFKEQINGGIDECCEALFNGVPFNSGLNSAARVNVGLDIINTLSDYYGFRAPVFVDNAESVNEIIPMDTQVISLVVSKDKELTVSETEALRAS